MPITFPPYPLVHSRSKSFESPLEFGHAQLLVQLVQGLLLYRLSIPAQETPLLINTAIFSTTVLLNHDRNYNLRVHSYITTNVPKGFTSGAAFSAAPIDEASIREKKRREWIIRSLLRTVDAAREIYRRK